MGVNHYTLQWYNKNMVLLKKRPQTHSTVSAFTHHSPHVRSVDRQTTNYLRLIHIKDIIMKKNVNMFPWTEKKNKKLIYNKRCLNYMAMLSSHSSGRLLEMNTFIYLFTLFFLFFFSKMFTIKQKW